MDYFWGAMKINRKFKKTSLFEKNMKIDVMEDVYVNHHRRWKKRLMVYLMILAILLILSVLLA